MNRRLILWDIDGTLIRSGPFSAEVFALAIEEVLGARPQASVAFSGKTDRHIAQELLGLSGSEDPDHLEAVLRHLENVFAEHAHRLKSEGFVCPGVETVLSRLAVLDSVEQTVLTGNIAPNALAKLAAFGLDRYLDLQAGAYGGEHLERSDLLPLALQRQRELYGVDYRPDETWIVGDTPRDFACARAGGVHCLLVATGRYDLSELELLGADETLKDLSEADHVVALLSGIS